MLLNMILDCWIESTCRLAFMLDCNCLKPIVQWVIAQQGVLAQHIYITFLKKNPQNTFIFLRDCVVRFAWLIFLSGFCLPVIHWKLCTCSAILPAQAAPEWCASHPPEAPRCRLTPFGFGLPSVEVFLVSAVSWAQSSGAVFRREVFSLISFQSWWLLLLMSQVVDSLILLRGAFVIFLSRFFGYGRCLLTESSFWSTPLVKIKQCLTGKGMQLHSRGHGLKGIRKQDVKMGENGNKRQVCLDVCTFF